ncbi:Scr1 family TA system antitoxin-like transcriptional regulator [Streptomyces sp. NPDC050211]|uniref:Scr1 family TA system antitoxin-like transcriptional regulator n=1 Tax=Streptomyces sp. NPDC050211 TaxID=3154932 RepID=UPI003419577A
MERAGLTRVQQSVAPLFERTRRFRAYQSWVIPGLLQSAAYTRAVLSTVAHLRDVPDDIDDAVAVRMDRQRILHSGDHRFAMLVEERVLRTVIGDNTMAGALDHLISVASLPSVSVGIIPSARRVAPDGLSSRSPCTTTHRSTWISSPHT